MPDLMRLELAAPNISELSCLARTQNSRWPRNSLAHPSVCFLVAAPMGKRSANKKSGAAAAKADEKARQKWSANLAPRFTKYRTLLSKPIALACT